MFAQGSNPVLGRMSTRWTERATADYQHRRQQASDALAVHLSPMSLTRKTSMGWLQRRLSGFSLPIKALSLKLSTFLKFHRTVYVQLSKLYILVLEYRLAA
jgi:hypothetical protein